MMGRLIKRYEVLRSQSIWKELFGDGSSLPLREPRGRPTGALVAGEVPPTRQLFPDRAQERGHVPNVCFVPDRRA